ncbi:alkaline phosphatase family protein [Acaryochloris thomasi]|nr:alkaline phosphatase family protein [Acaryochloris thomasi]
MNKKVVAIGLDAAPPKLLNEWMMQGLLPNLQSLRMGGAYAPLTNLDYFKAETPWTTFLTGCMPQKTGYWGPVKLQSGTYEIEEIGAYDFQPYAPFYALGDRYRVAAFDVPQSTLSDRVNGIQVLGWGAHSPQTPSYSKPEHLFAQIQNQHGEHPALHKDHGSWWDCAYINRLHQSLLEGLKRRVDICRSLLRQEEWDLFLTIFGETHSAGHDLWHLSQPQHPVYPYRAEGMPQGDPMLDVFQAADDALGKILAETTDDTSIVVFSGHGSGDNSTDVMSMLFLPEFLYRFNFAGAMMFVPDELSVDAPPLVASARDQGWSEDIWERRYVRNPVERLLRSHLPKKFHRYINRLFAGDGRLATSQQLKRQGQAYYWQPAMWFKPFWPQMRAFALPSFSEGYIRINLAGREPNGLVNPESYDQLCAELTEQLYLLVNPRTGKPVVDKVILTRAAADDRDDRLPDADLVVKWNDVAVDVVEHPQLGRIGPVPYRRTGSHRAQGFMIAKGPGIEPGSTLSAGHCVDLAPTILDLMGAPIPDHLDGKSLVKASRHAHAANAV